VWYSFVVERIGLTWAMERVKADGLFDRKTKRQEKNNIMPKTKQEKARVLQKLSDAADASRVRVSAYTDEQRNQLEQFARGLIQGDTKQVCRR
jgi:hypothetical protein